MLQLSQKIKPLFFTLISAIPMTALAGPPFLTDDTVPTPYQHFELYLASILSGNNNESIINVPSIELDYGLLPNFEADFIPSGVANLQHRHGEANSYGLGDTSLSFKFRFIQETDNCPQMSFNPGVFLPTGDANRDLGNGRASEVIPFWAQKSWGQWTLDTGGGYAINSAPGMLNYFYGGLLIQKALNPRLTLGGEIFSQGAASNEQGTTTIANFGGNYSISDSFSLLFSLGHSIIGDNNIASYMGLYWTW